MDDSIYYAHAGSLPLVKRVSYNARAAVVRLFMRAVAPTAATRVLDVGVSLDTTSVEANLLEQQYPHRRMLTCAGIGDGSSVEKAYPGVKFVEITPHQPLPFPDGHFDVVYSNAVVEHVGSRQNQAAFVRDLCRVAKHAFVVVPNRLFPLEHHTGLPLMHYLPLPAFRGMLRPTRWSHWAKEENLNPILAGDLRRMFPQDRSIAIHYCGLGLGPFRSNLVAIACPSC